MQTRTVRINTEDLELLRRLAEAVSYGPFRPSLRQVLSVAISEYAFKKGIPTPDDAVTGHAAH